MKRAFPIKFQNPEVMGKKKKIDTTECMKFWTSDCKIYHKQKKKTTTENDNLG